MYHYLDFFYLLLFNCNIMLIFGEIFKLMMPNVFVFTWK